MMRVLSWLIFSPVPMITLRSFSSALPGLIAALGIPLDGFQLGQCSHLSNPSWTEAVPGISHPHLVAPEALLKVHPVSVPPLLMASPCVSPWVLQSVLDTHQLSSCWWPHLQSITVFPWEIPACPFHAQKWLPRCCAPYWVLQQLQLSLLILTKSRLLPPQRAQSPLTPGWIIPTTSQSSSCNRISTKNTEIRGQRTQDVSFPCVLLASPGAGSQPASDALKSPSG